MALRCRNGIMNARPSPGGRDRIRKARYPERDRRETTRCPRNRESHCPRRAGVTRSTRLVIQKGIGGRLSAAQGMGSLVALAGRA